MKNKLLYLIFIIHTGFVAQQIPLSTLYSYNTIQLNPAVAGIEKGIHLNLAHRQQWVGFDGAPITTWLTSQMQLSPKIGIGFSMSYDQVSFLERFQSEGTFAYHLKIDKKSTLDMGISLGFLQGSLNLNDVISFNDINDPIIQNSNLNGIAFNSQFGLAYTFNNKLNIGLSIPHLFTSSIDMSLETIEGAYDLVKHNIIYASYNIDLSQDIRFKPMFLIRKVSDIESQWDFMGNLDIKNKYWGGFGIRQHGGFIVNIGMNAIEDLGITYAYEFNRNGVAYFSSGSHEIMLSYKLGNNVKSNPLEETEEIPSEDIPSEEDSNE